MVIRSRRATKIKKGGKREELVMHLESKIGNVKIL